MSYKMLLTFVTIIICCEGAKILGIVPTPSYSHQVAFQPLWKELSLRGHQVTTITTNPIGDVSLVNLTEIDMKFLYDTWNKNLAELTKMNFIKAVFSFNDLYKEIEEMLLSHPPVQDLIQNSSEGYDLVMAEYSMLSVFAFGPKFKCPTVVLTSLQPMTYLNHLVGNPNHVAIYPDPFIPEQELGFVYCLINLIMYWFLYAVQSQHLHGYHQEMVNKYFGVDYPPLINILENSSLVLTNSDPIFYKPRPIMPNIIQIGGKVTRLPSKPLSAEVESKLNSSINGFIYFSLGSNAKSKDLSEGTFNIILETFADLPYTVLWKFEEDTLKNLPSNIIVQKWLPQQNVLNHPNIKLFITQGGLQSREEAIYARVPMVGMPIFGDQIFNVKSMVMKGFGLMVDHTTLQKDEFKNTILEVINNPIYKNKVTELSVLAEDQPMSGLEKAIWWTEYVIRNKGAEHLRSPLLDVPTYRYFLLDIISVLVLSLIGATVISIYLIKKIFTLISKQRKVKTN